MVSGITPCARECKWIVYFGETPKRLTESRLHSQAVFLIIDTLYLLFRQLP